MSRALCILAATWLLGSAAALAQQHSHGDTGAAAARPALGASAAFDRDGRLWAVHADGPQLRLSVSDDLGREWRDAGPVNAAPEAIAADGDNRPKLAFGPQGRLYVSWTRPLARPYTGEIRFATAAHAGEAFGPPQTVHRDRQQITHRFDALTVTADGTLVISWIDKRDRESALAAGQDYRGAAVYYAHSRDGGASFEAERLLAPHSCECCRIALAPRRDGSVQALWRHVFEPSIRDHATLRFEPGGQAGPLRRATRDEWSLDACPHHGPSLVEDAQSRLHAVWFTGAPGREGVYYGQLDDEGMQHAVKLPDDTAAHADLAVAGRELAVAWKRFDGQATELRAMRSHDGGLSWSAAVTLARSAEATGQPFVLAHEGRFVVFWHGREHPLGTWRLP